MLLDGKLMPDWPRQSIHEETHEMDIKSMSILVELGGAGKIKQKLTEIQKETKKRRTH
jgi:glucose dehydrogenase